MNRIKIGRILFLKNVNSYVDHSSIKYFVIPPFFLFYKIQAFCVIFRILHPIFPLLPSPSYAMLLPTEVSPFPRKPLNQVFLCKSYPSFKAKVMVHLCQEAMWQVCRKSQYSRIRNTEPETQLCYLLAIISGKLPNLYEH